AREWPNPSKRKRRESHSRRHPARAEHDLVFVASAELGPDAQLPHHVLQRDSWPVDTRSMIDLRIAASDLAHLRSNVLGRGDETCVVLFASRLERRRRALL